jgi:two-component system cell cycle sensor histidine kinase/response regulator CckA
MAPEWRSRMARYGLAMAIFACIAAVAVLLSKFSIQLNLSIIVGAGLAAAAWYAGRGPAFLLLGLLVVLAATTNPVREGVPLASMVFTYVSAGTVFAGLVWLISGRRISERRLTEQGELLRITLGSIGDGVIATDQDGKVNFVNATASRLLACMGEEPLGRQLSDVYSLVYDDTGEPAGDVFEQVKSRRETVTFARDVSIACGPGRSIPVLDSAAPIIGEGGRFLGAVVVFQDDTERREAERREKETETRRQQSQKLEAVGRLTGGIAHDFNNLLTTMIGYTELAAGRVPAGSREHEYLLNVQSAGERAADLTRHLLAFSRRQRLETRPVDMNATIAEIARLLERVIGEHIEVSVKGDPDLQAAVADPTQIEQVIMNLVLNARDAMPDGGEIVIDMSNARLDENFCRQFPECRPGDYVMLLVSDTGHGMEPEILQRVFEPFFTTKPSGSGTGLGLSIAYGIVKQHGGHISACSEPGRGTTFKIYLPAAGECAITEAASRSTQLRGGNETILLADDEESLRQLSRDVLESLGYTVLTARNGEEALEIFRLEKDHIDLLLLDVVMPMLGGIDAYREIRHTGAEPPVIFATGYSSEMVGDTVNTSGVNFSLIPVIQKPYTLEGLGKIVRETLDMINGGEIQSNHLGRSASQAQ